MLSCK